MPDKLPINLTCECGRETSEDWSRLKRKKWPACPGCGKPLELDDDQMRELAKAERDLAKLDREVRKASRTINIKL